MKPTLARIGPKVAGQYIMKQNLFCKSNIFQNIRNLIPEIQFYKKIVFAWCMLISDLWELRQRVLSKCVLIGIAV